MMDALKFTVLCAIFVLSVLLIGCSAGQNPLEPVDFHRSSQDFSAPVELWPTASFVDISNLREGPYEDGSPSGGVLGVCKEWDKPPNGGLDVYGFSCTIGITNLNSSGTYGTDIDFSFTGCYGLTNPILFSSDVISAIAPESNEYQYSFGKVDTIYLNPLISAPGITGIIEMAVVYRYRLAEGEPWMLGLSVTRFEEGQFEDPDAEPPIPETWGFLNGDLDEPIEQWNRFFILPIADSMGIHYPDLCYDPETGDLYIVYTKNMGEGPQLFCIHLLRSEYATWETGGPVEYEWPLSDPVDHQAYQPSIAIGGLDDTIPGVETNMVGGGTDLNYCAVAYTSYYPTVTPIETDIWVTYWPIESGNQYNEPGDGPEMSLRRPNQVGPAGYPCLDIVPPNQSQDEGYAIIIYTERDSDFPDPSLYSLWLIESVDWLEGPWHKIVNSDVNDVFLGSGLIRSDAFKLAVITCFVTYPNGSTLLALSGFDLTTNTQSSWSYGESISESFAPLSQFFVIDPGVASAHCRVSFGEDWYTGYTGSLDAKSDNTVNAVLTDVI